MIKYFVILLLVTGNVDLSAQTLPESEPSDASKHKSYWAYELKEATEISDSSKIVLFNIENYLDVLQPDSVQFILDSISGLSWVVYPRSIKPEQGVGLISLPPELQRTYPNKSSE